MRREFRSVKHLKNILGGFSKDQNGYEISWIFLALSLPLWVWPLKKQTKKKQLLINTSASDIAIVAPENYLFAWKKKTS